MSKQNNFLTKVVPIALTVIGSISTVAAVIFAAKEGPKYQKALEEKEMTTPQKITTAVKTFAPAIGCTTLSVACGVGAHMMDMHTQASLTGAYIAAQGAYKKFREKNKELNGEGANEKVLEEIQKEEFQKGESQKELRDKDGEKIYNIHLMNLSEDLPEVHFQASSSDIMNRMMWANIDLEIIGFLSLNDILIRFGQEKVDGGNDIGWSSDMLYRLCQTGQLFQPYDEDDKKGNDFTISPVCRAYGDYLTGYEY